MRELVSTARVVSELHGHGVLSRGTECLEVSFSLTRDKYALSTPWELRAVPTDAKARVQALFAGDPNEPMSLVGQLDSGARGLRIADLIWPAATGNLLRSEVWRFELSEGDVPEQACDWWVTVYLTETPLAQSEALYRIRDTTGRHEAPTTYKDPVGWQTELGAYEFSRWYAFEEVALSGAKATLEIPYPSIRIRIADRTGPAHILDQVEAELKDILRLLGLLGRRRVMWTRITLMPIADQRMAWSSVQRCQIAGDSTTLSYIRWPLVDAGTAQEVFNSYALQRFQRHHLAHAMRTSLDLLATSRERSVQFGGHRFITAFAAFEAIVNAISETRGFAKLVSGNQEKRLLKEVRGTIHRFVESEGLPTDVVDAVRKKLPELVRLSFVERATRALLELRVDVNNVWPEGSDLESELRAIAGRRNGLVHQGTESDISEAFPDDARLNLLTERIICALLDWDAQWTSPAAGRDYDWLRTRE